MKPLLLVPLALAMELGCAQAADLKPLPMYQPVARVVPAFDWTGCYIGSEFGGLRASTHWVDQIPADAAFGADLGSAMAYGAMAGVRGSCNYQLGSWVLGFDGDYAWTSSSGAGVSVFPATLTTQARLKALASVRGRVGYAWDNLLTYASAGGASARSDLSLAASGVTIANGTETRGGWTVGIGAEYAFLDWLTAFVELDYYRFGSGANAFSCAVCAGTAVEFSLSTSITVLKVGLNFTSPNSWDPQRLKSTPRTP